METLDVLKGARELLSDPAKWTKAGALAVDVNGAPVGVDHEEGNALHPEAVAWCLIGACQKVAEDAALAWDNPHLAFVRDCAGTDYLGPWNDKADRTHADVLAVLDCAIAKASA
jgi:hypothetical protein